MILTKDELGKMFEVKFNQCLTLGLSQHIDWLLEALKPYLDGHECEYGWNAETTKEGTIITVTNKGKLVFEHRCAHHQPERRTTVCDTSELQEHGGSVESSAKIFLRYGCWWADRRKA